jgi:hypothetical protein
LVFGFWFLVFGFWFLVFGFWFLVFGFWFLVFGFWFCLVLNFVLKSNHFNTLIFGIEHREDFTVGISLGDTRRLEFVHEKSRASFSIPQVFSFLNHLTEFLILT